MRTKFWTLGQEVTLVPYHAITEKSSVGVLAPDGSTYGEVTMLVVISTATPALTVTAADYTCVYTITGIVLSRT